MNTLNELLEINIITEDLLKDLSKDIELSKDLYNRLTTNDRGLDKSKLSGYYERHHILPKCMGGKDEDNNYVLLTYKEHVLAHMLLYIIYKNNKKLLIAFKTMISVKKLSNILVDLCTIESIKEEFSEYLKENNPMKNPEVVKKQRENTSKEKLKEKQKLLSQRMKENNPMKDPIVVEKMRKSKIGKKTSIQTRDLMSSRRKGKKMSDDQKNLISKLRKEKNIHLSDESKSKMIHTKNSKILSPEGIEFDSLTAAAKSIGISRTSLKSWIDNRPDKGWKLI